MFFFSPRYLKIKLFFSFFKSPQTIPDYSQSFKFTLELRHKSSCNVQGPLFWFDTKQSSSSPPREELFFLQLPVAILFTVYSRSSNWTYATNGAETCRACVFVRNKTKIKRNSPRQTKMYCFLFLELPVAIIYLIGLSSEQ